MDSEVRSGCLHLRGDITVRSLNGKNYRRFQEQCRQSETHSIDWSGVAAVDSASLSLLLAARRIRGAGSLKHLALPAAACELAALYDIEDWIAE